MNTRELARKAIKAKIMSSAIKLIRVNGYMATTVEDIANDVGMSKRNFFRYYSSKDDLLLEPSHRFCEVFLSSFHEKLATLDIWSALHLCLQDHALWCIQTCSPDHATVEVIIRGSPVLLAKQLELIERLQVDATDAYCSSAKCIPIIEWRTVNAIVRTAFACLQSVQCRPLEIDGRDAFQALMDAMRPTSLCKFA